MVAWFWTCFKSSSCLFKLGPVETMIAVLVFLALSFIIFFKGIDSIISGI